MKPRLALLTLLGAAANGCGITENFPMPPPVVAFELRNGGTESTFLFQGCLLDYAITSLVASPYRIERGAGCSCDCDQGSCPVCQPCSQGPQTVIAGSAVYDRWTAVNITLETTASGSCERKQRLPDGPYRIDVPVYGTAEDAAARTNARTVTQEFSIPTPGGLVSVALSSSP